MIEPLSYASVCAGICAATVAWKPLGWRAQFFSEWDPETEAQFPAQVLAHHYPGIPNHGDLTRWAHWPDSSFDVLVGGTPCQGFSIAGKRAGLADDRSGLAWAYLEVVSRYHPRWVVWENVPGVLSSEDGRDFRAFLDCLGKLGYGWAYRVLDAQFFGVAQRRRRVFVVGCLGNWAAPAAVLFERPRLQWDPAPRRTSGENPAPTLADGSNGGGANGPGRSVDSADSLQVVGALGAGKSAEGTGRYNLVAGTLGSNHGNVRADQAWTGQLVPEISNALSARDGKGQATNTYQGPPLIVHTLRGEGHDASEDGSMRGTPLVVADLAQITSVTNRTQPRPGEPAPSKLASTSRPVAFNVFPSAGQGADLELRETDIASSLGAVGDDRRERGTRLALPFGVRRLTPRECERLQGFPDDYTRIPVMRQGDRIWWAKDSPRYKAIGNSMAVPVMRWLGEGIQLVDSVIEEELRRFWLGQGAM